MSTEVMPTDQAAELLGLKPPTLRKAIVTKVGLCSDLPYIKAGRRVLYRRVDLEAWLEKHLVTPATI